MSRAQFTCQGSKPRHVFVTETVAPLDYRHRSAKRVLRVMVRVRFRVRARVPHEVHLVSRDPSRPIPGEKFLGESQAL